jgi:hypothetical protein
MCSVSASSAPSARAWRIDVCPGRLSAARSCWWPSIRSRLLLLVLSLHHASRACSVVCRFSILLALARAHSSWRPRCVRCLRPLPAPRLLPLVSFALTGPMPAPCLTPSPPVQAPTTCPARRTTRPCRSSLLPWLDRYTGVASTPFTTDRSSAPSARYQHRIPRQLSMLPRCTVLSAHCSSDAIAAITPCSLPQTFPTTPILAT